MFKNACKNIALLCLSLAVTLFLAEAALRIIYPKPKDGVMSSLEYRHRWILNSDGFREGEFDEKIAKKRQNVVLLGDSFAAGLGSEREDSFATLLENSMQKEGFEFFNLGKCGTNTIDQNQILAKYIRSIRPKKVTLFFFWNDLKDNFLYNTGGSAGALLKTEKGKIVTSFSILNPVRPWLEKTILYQLLRNYYRGYLNKIGVAKLDLGIEMDVFKKSVDSPAVKLAWVNTENEILKMRSLCRQSSAELCVVYIPKKEQLLGWEKVVRFYKVSGDDYDRFLPEKKLAEFCGSKNIEFVDVSSELDIASGKEKLYYNVDGHLTRAGNRIFFDRIRPALTAWIRKSD